MNLAFGGLCNTFRSDTLVSPAAAAAECDINSSVSVVYLLNADAG